MKWLFTLMAAMLFQTTAWAQQPQPGKEDRAERMEALYVAYMTRELKLTSDEAEKFWPIHRNYEEALKSVAKNQPTLKIQEDQLQVRKKFETQFKKIIGEERTDLFYQKDAAFKEKLAQRLRQSGSKGRTPNKNRASQQH